MHTAAKNTAVKCASPLFPSFIILQSYNDTLNTFCKLTGKYNKTNQQCETNCFKKHDYNEMTCTLSMRIPESRNMHTAQQFRKVQSLLYNYPNKDKNSSRTEEGV